MISPILTHFESTGQQKIYQNYTLRVFESLHNSWRLTDIIDITQVIPSSIV